MRLTARPKAQDASQEREPGTRGRRPKKRWLRVMSIAALTLVAVLLASTLVNLVMEKRERSSMTPYGDRVSVAGGTMNVWRNERPGPTIVLLSGLGTAAPALDFAPLVRELDNYNVVVVEGFGYGYADRKGPPRTVENITAELHEVLSKLDVEKPYVLAGHSIAGFYTLSYANRYPEEVSAVVGIDPTVPAAKAGDTGPVDGGINWGRVLQVTGRVLQVTGVVRVAIAIAPSLAEQPTGDAYSVNELAQMHRLAVWNFGNPAVVDETIRIGSNAAALRGVTYPDALPVLTFLAKDSVSELPGWVEQHEDQLRNVKRHEIVVLDGSHYLHWTQSPAMAERITDFLGQN